MVAAPLGRRGEGRAGAAEQNRGEQNRGDRRYWDQRWQERQRAAAERGGRDAADAGQGCLQRDAADLTANDAGGICSAAYRAAGQGMVLQACDGTRHDLRPFLLVCGGWLPLLVLAR